MDSISSERIQESLYGFTRSQMLFTAVDLEVFTAIAQGRDTLAALCEALRLEPRTLRIFLEGLVGVGFLNKDGERFCLPDDVVRYLVKTEPTYLGGMVTHCKRLSENWAMLTDVVRSGHPTAGAHGMAEVEANFAELAQGLYVSNYPAAQHLAQILGLQPGQGLKILDVAAGSAVWSIPMLERDPRSHATVLDYPPVLNVARAYVAQHHLQERYHYIAGDLEVMDFPQGEPEGGFDVAILGNICHIIGPYSTQNLFFKLAKSLKPGGRVVIVDFVPDDARAKTGWPLLFGVNLLIASPEGEVFSAAQYRQWLEAAGFAPPTLHDLGSDLTAVVAVLRGASPPV